MKTTKEQADELIEQFFGEVSNAITAVEHTIEVLNKIQSPLNEWITKDNIKYRIDEQTELLNELKSRL